MEYRENELCYEDYCSLRESVGWLNFSRTQTENALTHGLYTVTAVENNHTVGMGRLIGDGLYFMAVDIVVRPTHQKNGIGSQILNRIMEYVDKETPVGGRSSIQLLAEKGKEAFYERLGFQVVPHDFCGSAMRKVIRK